LLHVCRPKTDASTNRATRVTRKAKIAPNQAMTFPAGEAASAPQPAATTAVTIPHNALGLDGQVKEFELGAFAPHPCSDAAVKSGSVVIDRQHEVRAAGGSHFLEKVPNCSCRRYRPSTRVGSRPAGQTWRFRGTAQARRPATPTRGRSTGPHLQDSSAHNTRDSRVRCAARAAPSLAGGAADENCRLTRSAFTRERRHRQLPVDEVCLYKRATT
jgi:hypothetical protein